MLTIRKRTIIGIPLLEVVPEDVQNDPLPLVIYYHGWQTSKELALTPARKIAGHNIRVILPDAMYHGERQCGPISSIPSFTFWSTLQYNLLEFESLVNYFDKNGMIADGKLGAGGYSMGGITTAALLKNHPEITAGVILMGTPKLTAFRRLLISYITEHAVYAPKELEQLLGWLDFFDLSQAPEALTGRPLYFWHGTNDEKVPYADAFDFYQSYKDHWFGQNMVFHTGDGKRHLITPDIMAESAHFLAEHLS
ncbi:prolyl oligopeptidase family serine peptidase [Vagococcus acidifermentans]|uniref:Peptidase S9 prolyl oligopeptidase catalytic domain-containing protein n=1 Tax=Vagococcus acidifermentans TaxID=564710 RepID=A0A430ASE1_9ENTE|nr:prolyl oligopeptidase family serine peptidase [Vagococcus acidifermentans]RSU10974.1 hypothetical protein CBF27_09785 [Vagococcus acidifermentans]